MSLGKEHSGAEGVLRFARQHRYHQSSVSGACSSRPGSMAVHESNRIPVAPWVKVAATGWRVPADGHKANICCNCIFARDMLLQQRAAMPNRPPQVLLNSRMRAPR
jgi:hypothetical protein